MGHAKTSSDYSGVGWPCPKFHVCPGQNHKNSLVAVQNMGPVARFELQLLPTLGSTFSAEIRDYVYT